VARFIVFVLIGVFVAVLVIASVTVHRASAATIATDAPATPITMDVPATPIATDAPATSIATDAPAAAIAADSPAPLAHQPELEHDATFGRFLFEPYKSSHGTYGVRFGADMLGTQGRGTTRLASGMRFTLGTLVEFQFAIGVARVVADDTCVMLVAPLGGTLGMDFDPRGYAGLEGVVASPHLEVGAGVSLEGARAHAGLIRPGRETGIGFGVDWLRERDADMIGVYFATTPPRE
jgi:hypothetical protein